MCRNKIGKRLLGVVLSGVLMAGMGMTVFAEEIDTASESPSEYVYTIKEGCSEVCDGCRVSAYECTADCTCGKDDDVRCVVKPRFYAPSASAYITIYCCGNPLIEPVDSEDESEPSPEEKVSTEIDMEVSRQVDQAVAAAVAAGQTKDDAKAAAVVKLNSKYLYGTNGFSVYKMQDFQNANVDIDFEYDYDGYHYSIHMPAGQIPIDEDVPVYGPLYLAKIFSEGLTVTPIVEEAE